MIYFTPPTIPFFTINYIVFPEAESSRLLGPLVEQEESDFASCCSRSVCSDEKPIQKKTQPLTKFEAQVDTVFNWQELVKQKGYFDFQSDTWEFVNEFKSENGCNIKMYKRMGPCGFDEYASIMNLPKVSAEQHWSVTSDVQNYKNWQTDVEVDVIFEGLASDGSVHKNKISTNYKSNKKKRYN